MKKAIIIMIGILLLSSIAIGITFQDKTVIVDKVKPIQLKYVDVNNSDYIVRCIYDDDMTFFPICSEKSYHNNYTNLDNYNTQLVEKAYREIDSKRGPLESNIVAEGNINLIRGVIKP